MPTSTIDPAAILQQGGFFAVLLVVLYFYRRDYGRLVSEKDAYITQLIEMVRNGTRVLSEHNEVSGRIARAVEHMNTRRRATDPARRRDDDDKDALPEES
jgi:hypothetical protein